MSDAPRRETASSARDEHEGPTAPAGPSREADGPDPDALGAWSSPGEQAEPVPAGADDAATHGEATAADGDAPDQARQGAPEQDVGAAADPTGPAPSDAEPDPRSREELLEALTTAEQERDEYLDGVRRTRAEFENYRKRTMSEGAAQRELGKVEVLEGLLEVLDDLDRTLDAAAASSDETLSRGVELVAEKLVRQLRDAGLERVDATGVTFDPHRHEAVQQAEAEQPREEPVVTQVLRPGYLLGERVLRAAMVVVEQ